VNPGAAQVFVYYRVAPGNVPQLIDAVRALQARWCAAHPGLACSLSRRAEEGAEVVTLMETYRHDRVALDAWHHDIERSAREQLATWIIGGRHVEVFVACA